MYIEEELLEMKKEPWLIDYPASREMVCGGVAGSLGIAVGNPFDIVKVRMQTSPDLYSGSMACARTMYKNEGFGSFYKGMSAPFLLQTACQAILFTGDTMAMKVLEPNLRPHEPPKLHTGLLAGAFGGSLSCLLLVPIDNIKCRLQTQGTKFKGVFDVMRQITKQEGATGLFRGMVVTMAREAPSFGIYFLTYKWSRDFLINKKVILNEDMATMMAGGLAGCMSWGVVYPVDVVKTKIQTAQVGTLASDLTMAKVAKDIYRTQGIAGFGHGLTVVLVRAFVVNAFQFYFYEKLKLHI